MDRDQLMTALKNATAAGDDESAIRIAQMISSSDKPVKATDDMSGIQKFTAGMGKAFVDTGRGIADFAYDAIPGEQWGEGKFKQNLENAKERDSDLMSSGAGIAGNITGNIAAFAPTAFIPGVNTARGASLVGAGMGALQPTTEDESRVVNTGIGAAGGYLGNKVGEKVVKGLSNSIRNQGVKRVENQIKDQTIAEARKQGYTIPPTMTRPNALNKSLEGLSGKINTQQASSIKNQQVTNKLAKRALGLSDDAPLTQKTINSIRDKAGKEYEKVSSLGKIVADDQYIDDLGDVTADYAARIKDFPTDAVKQIDDLVDDMVKESFDSKNLVSKVKKLRFDSSKHLRSDDPGMAELGLIKRQIADKLEDLIERNVGDDSLKAFKEARKLYAKTFSVEDALQTSTGNVSAGNLAKQASKGVPLSGELKTIAGIADFAPKANQLETSSFIGMSPLDYMGGLLTMGATGNPLGLAVAGARPVARNAILSKAYQSAMTAPNYNATTQRALRGLLGNRAAQTGMSLSAPASVGLFQQ